MDTCQVHTPYNSKYFTKLTFRSPETPTAKIDFESVGPTKREAKRVAAGNCLTKLEEMFSNFNSEYKRLDAIKRSEDAENRKFASYQNRKMQTMHSSRGFRGGQRGGGRGQ